MLGAIICSAVDCRIASDGCVTASYAEDKFVWWCSGGRNSSEKGKRHSICCGVVT